MTRQASTDMSIVPDYDQVDAALGSLGQAGSVAEAHGSLCGMLSAGGIRAGHAWVEELLLGVDPIPSTRDVLDVLVHASATRLTAPELDFQPLLPDDQSELSLRALSLSEWVQAYLYGLGVGGFDTVGTSEEIGEALMDLEQIGRVEFDMDHGDESDEVAYAEVLEFVRMSVILIKDEIGALRGEELLH
jgi:uncharacterized protein YgfB (UPF0149 family)